MNQVTLSIIIILYHSKHIINSLLDNLNYKFHGIDYEIILVDNSNEDIKFDDSIIQVYSSEVNLGYGAGINFGAKIAKGKFLLILNPDIKIDEFEIDFKNCLLENNIISGLRNNNKQLNKFPNIFFDTYKHITYKTWGIYQDNIYRHENKILDNNNLIQFVDWVFGDLLLISKPNFQKIGGFDERFFLFYEEIDICKRAFDIGIRSIINSNIKFSTTSIKASNVNVDYIKQSSEFKSFKTYYSTHYNKDSTFLICILLKFYFAIIYFITIPFFFIPKMKKKRKGLYVKIKS